jgi:hypothetical protein
MSFLNSFPFFSSEKKKLIKKFESNTNNITNNETNLNKLLTILAESSDQDDFTNLKKFIKKAPKTSTGKKKLSLDVLVAAYYFNEDKDVNCLQYLLCNDSNIFFESLTNINNQKIDKDKLVQNIILLKENENKEDAQKYLLDNILKNFKERKKLNKSHMKNKINIAFNNLLKINGLNNARCKKYCRDKNCEL